MTIIQLISDRYHRRHTREGGYPVFKTTFFDSINVNFIHIGPHTAAFFKFQRLTALGPLLRSHHVCKGFIKQNIFRFIRVREKFVITELFLLNRENNRSKKHQKQPKKITRHSTTHI